MMKNLLSVVSVFLFFSGIACGQYSRQAQDSIRKLTQDDYKNMLDQVGTKSTRPGPSGTPTAPNAANTDESKATQYTSLPDPLVLNNGKKVKSEKVWWKKRRPEIKEYFDREIYGRVPANVPGVRWEVVSVTNDSVGPYPVITKRLSGHVDNSASPSISVNIDLTLVTPAKSAGPVPVILEFGFALRMPSVAARSQVATARPQTAPPRPQGPTGPSWQQQVLEAGWGYAILVPGSFRLITEHSGSMPGDIQQDQTGHIL